MHEENKKVSDENLFFIFIFIKSAFTDVLICRHTKNIGTPACSLQTYQ